MKVVIVSASKNGGAGKAAFRLHSNLLKSGLADSTFLVPTTDKSAGKNIVTLDSAFSKDLLNKFLKKIRYQKKKYNLKYYLKSLKVNYEMATLPFSNFRIEKEKVIKEADIINIHWVADFLNYKSFFKNTKKPIVWTLHDMNAFQGLFHYEADMMSNELIVGGYDNDLINKKIRYVHQHKNIHVVCLSKWLMEKSQQSAVLGRYPHYLIPNGLDFKNYEANFDEKEYKLETGINLYNKTLLFVSDNIHNHRKGFDILYDALHKIQNIAFNIITVGGDKIELPKNYNHIHFKWISNDNEINKLYTISDLFILPSREDNLPNVMLESFANGTPVLSFNTGGMKDYIIQGKNGILIDNFDSTDLSNQILNFHNNKYNFDSNYIRDFAKKNFDSEIQAQGYVQLFETILKKNR